MKELWYSKDLKKHICSMSIACHGIPSNRESRWYGIPCHGNQAIYFGFSLLWFSLVWFFHCYRRFWFRAIQNKMYSRARARLTSREKRSPRNVRWEWARQRPRMTLCMHANCIRIYTFRLWSKRNKSIVHRERARTCTQTHERASWAGNWAVICSLKSLG